MILETWRWGARPAVLLSLLLLVGCGLFGRKSYIIPEENTAAEQFSVAAVQEKRARGTLVKATKVEEFRKAVAAYDAVISRFPSDQQYVPAAWIAKSELWYLMGSEDSSSYARALAGFRMAADKYADQPDIRAAALWGLGRTHDQLARERGDTSAGRTSQQNAQTAYKAIIDEFSNHEDPAIRALAQQAKLRYRIVR